MRSSSLVQAGLGLSALDWHSRHYYWILCLIESGQSITQRSLSEELGISLGLTNRLIKRLSQNGLVRITEEGPGRRIRYQLTDRGAGERDRLSMLSLENIIQLYRATREGVRQVLEELLPPHGQGPQKVIFYGAGELAEIAYASLDHSVFDLVGVLDDCRNGQKFFGRSIQSPEDLLGRDEPVSYDRILVTIFNNSQEIRDRLSNLSVPDQRVVFLFAAGELPFSHIEPLRTP